LFFGRVETGIGGYQVRRAPQLRLMVSIASSGCPNHQAAARRPRRR
jgi:hypothetical protein